MCHSLPLRMLGSALRGAASHAGAPQARCVPAKVIHNTAGLHISWRDGHQSFYHTIWLRDHCPQDLHPTTGQRQVDTFHIPLDITVKESSVAPCSMRLHVSFSDHKLGVFDLGWLRDHCYSPEEQSTRHKSAPKPVLWDSEHVVRPTPFQAFASNDEALRGALSDLLKYGFLMLEDVPSTVEATHAVADRIGCIRRTFYGSDVWDTKPKDAHVNDTAFTTLELKPHTDCTYFLEPPALQFFNCAEQAETGGSTWLVDGFHVASSLRTAAPEAFKFFSSRLIPFHHASPEDNVHMVSHAKVIEVDEHGEISRFRYNNDDRAPLINLASDDVPVFYRHLHKLTALTRAPHLGLFVRLKPRQALLVDNHRVMHGRTSFVGSRNLLGWYMDRDELISRARRLGLL